MAMNAVTRHGVSIALACRAFEISETCYRYSPVLSDENEEIVDCLECLTANKRNWGLALEEDQELVRRHLSIVMRQQTLKNHRLQLDNWRKPASCPRQSNHG